MVLYNNYILSHLKQVKIRIVIAKTLLVTSFNEKRQYGTVLTVGHAISAVSMKARLALASMLLHILHNSFIDLAAAMRFLIHLTRN